MSLRDLTPRISYRSGAGNVVDDFYVPCMERSILYRRAVGYFTSGALSLAARGAAQLIKSGGRIQLVTSPKLQASDVEAIERGYATRGQRIRQVIEVELDELANELEHERLGALASQPVLSLASGRRLQDHTLRQPWPAALPVPTDP